MVTTKMSAQFFDCNLHAFAKPVADTDRKLQAHCYQSPRTALLKSLSQWNVKFFCGNRGFNSKKKLSMPVVELKTPSFCDGLDAVMFGMHIRVLDTLSFDAVKRFMPKFEKR